MKRLLGSCLVCVVLLLTGCPYVLRYPEVIGPGLTDPSPIRLGEGEFHAVGQVGGWWDVSQGLRAVHGGGSGGLDIGLGRGFSLVVDSGARWASYEHPVIMRGRLGPRFRLLDHFVFGAGLGLGLGVLGTTPYIGGDLEFGVGGRIGPVLIGLMTRVGVAAPAYGTERRRLGLYLVPELGVVIYPDPEEEVGPYVSVGGNAGWALLGPGWRSLELRGSVGVKARFGPPGQHSASAPGDDEVLWDD